MHCHTLCCQNLNNLRKIRDFHHPSLRELHTLQAQKSRSVYA